MINQFQPDPSAKEQIIANAVAEIMYLADKYAELHSNAGFMIGRRMNTDNIRPLCEQARDELRAHLVGVVESKQEPMSLSTTSNTGWEPLESTP